MKEKIIERYEDFWYDIYNIEKEEVKCLKEYIEYTKHELRNYNPYLFDYNSILNFLLNKHFDYLDEAFTSLLIKNYNAYACLLRIIIENYATISLIKKNKSKEIWKDWYYWSFYKKINQIKEEPYKSKLFREYQKICDLNNIPIDYITSTGNYSWIKRINNKGYKENFYSVCLLISDKSIYEDFSYLSEFIHNNNYLSKTNWVDMSQLSKLIFMLYDYSERVIKLIYPHFIRRKKYNNLTIKLLESLDICINYQENISIFPKEKTN